MHELHLVDPPEGTFERASQGSNRFVDLLPMANWSDAWFAVRLCDRPEYRFQGQFSVASWRSKR
jgi:hypothetical protein